MSTIKFTAQLEPVPFPRPRFNSQTRATFNQPRYTAFKEQLGWYARAAMNGLAPLGGKVKITANFYRTRPKNTASRNWGDLDNHVKAVLDALNGICFADDRQVTEIHAHKFFGEPHIEITLEELSHVEG